MPCTHQLARARQQDTCHLCGFDLRGGSDQRIVRLVAPLAGQYCTFAVGELVKVKPSTRAGTLTVERATWRNSLTISNVLAYVPSHLVCTEPNVPGVPAAAGGTESTNKPSPPLGTTD